MVPFASLFLGLAACGSPEDDPGRADTSVDGADTAADTADTAPGPDTADTADSDTADTGNPDSADTDEPDDSGPDDSGSGGTNGGDTADTASPEDTGDTGPSEDTADTGPSGGVDGRDTAPPDTAVVDTGGVDTAPTGDPDGRDTAATPDTADTATPDDTADTATPADTADTATPDPDDTADTATPDDTADTATPDTASDADPDPADADGDGHLGTARGGDDCDDADAATYPGAPEACDGVQNDCDAAGWTDADEDGLATLLDADGVVLDNLTATFAAGAAGAPVAYALPTTGTVNLCRGTWYVAFDGVASDAAIVGVYGAADTTLEGDGASSIVTLEDGNVALSGLTFTGAGSARRFGGAVYLAAVSGSPTLAVDACVFTGNTAAIGSAVYAAGGAAVTISGSELHDNAGTPLGADTTTRMALSDTDVHDNLDTDFSGGGAYLSEGSSLSCTSSTGAHGFWGNADYAVVVDTYSSFASTDCQWGSGADENAPADAIVIDVYGPASGATHDAVGTATFRCSNAACP